MTGTSWSGELPIWALATHELRFELCTNGECNSALLTLDGTSTTGWSGPLGTRELSCLSEPSSTKIVLACAFADPARPVSSGDVFRITIASPAHCWSAEWRR